MCACFGGEGRQWRAKAAERTCGGGGGVAVWGEGWVVTEGGY